MAKEIYQIGEVPKDFNAASTDPNDWERWLEQTEGILSERDLAIGGVRNSVKKRTRPMRECDGYDVEDAPYKDRNFYAERDPVEDAFRSLEGRLFHMKYIKSPETEEALLAAVQECIAQLLEDGTPKDHIKIGCHGSCQTGDAMITVYERSGLQFHIDTKDIPGFELEAFRTLLTEELGVDIQDLDHYVSDV